MTVNGKRADAEQVQREMDRLDRLVAVQAAEIERLIAALREIADCKTYSEVSTAIKAASIARAALDKEKRT